MLFNSFQFLVFFPVVTIVFFLLPHRWRWLHLLISSCIFYAAFIPAYIFILFFTIIIDYVAGLAIERARDKKRKMLLSLSIIANVGVLCVFKYYNFFIDNINSILAFQGFESQPLPFLSLILPIGLSFHTFQAMSYTIEVYRGNQKAERHFGIYALYVMFYPQLVAGPIERPQNILNQFYERKYFSFSNLVAGLQMILWGLFKKVVIADRLSLFVNEIYNHPSHHGGMTFIVATIFFAFQIYCDFSGYSSIALGSARVMGYNLMQNFNMPYLATSIKEFWQRWHISLSTWFKDYVYIPLGGNRVSKWRWYYNIFITFMLSGIWHGANWTYVIWGALHGFYFIIGSWLPAGGFLNENNGTVILVRRLIIFLVVCFAWIFFRANSISDAFFIVKQISDVSEYSVHQFSLNIIPESKGSVYSIDIMLGWFWIAALVIYETVLCKYPWSNVRRPVRWTIYVVAVLVILLLGVYDNNQFIYFQF